MRSYLQHDASVDPNGYPTSCTAQRSIVPHLITSLRARATRFLDWAYPLVAAEADTERDRIAKSLTVVLGSGGAVMTSLTATTAWAVGAPIVILLAFGRRAGLWWFAAFLVALPWAVFFPRGGAPEPSETLVTGNFTIMLVGVSTFLFFLFAFFVRERDRAQDEADRERARSDALLLNILPTEIVARLKDGERVIADRFDDASVLFADIADFTPMSATMEPDELVQLLNEVVHGVRRPCQPLRRREDQDSRMESHGQAGRIQITESTRRHLDGRYRTSPGATVDVKGKGLTAVFFIEGRSEPGGPVNPVDCAPQLDRVAADRGCERNTARCTQPTVTTDEYDRLRPVERGRRPRSCRARRAGHRPRQ